MNSRHVSFFLNTFLFSGLDEKRVKELMSDVSFKEERFERGDTVFESTSDEALVFVYKGECTVERVRADEEAIPLNSLKQYASFGILSLFSDGSDFPTRITAKVATTLIFMSKRDAISLISRSPEVAINVTKFLCQRVSFLNERIATFTEKSTISKLCSYLLSATGTRAEDIPYSPTKLAAAIGTSRASLYRDLSVLERDGCIKIENKKIKILSSEGLERKQK